MDDQQSTQPFNGSNATSGNATINSVCNGDAANAPSSTDLPLVFPAADVKYFVGGFHTDVSEKDLRAHFSSFGSVADVKIMRDAASGRSRGFGFVTMAEPSSKQRIMAEKEHIIGGRKASVRPYAEQADLKDSFTDGPILKRKVFVGGVNPALGHEALENYFGKYGPLEDATIMRYPDGRSRGFGFVVFRDEAVCQQVLQQRNHCITLRDKVEVKPCLSRGKTKMPGPNGGMMGGGMDMHYCYGYNMVRGPYGGGPGVGGYGGGGYSYGGAGNYGYGNPGNYGMYGSSVHNVGNPVNRNGFPDYRDAANASVSNVASAATWAPYDTYGGYYGGWPGAGGYSGAGGLSGGPRSVVGSGNMSTPGQSTVPPMNTEGYYDIPSGVGVATTPNSLGGGHPGYAPIRRGPAAGGIIPPGLAPPYSQGMARSRIAPY